MGARTKNTIGARALKDRCAGLVSSVTNRRLASEAEITAFRPGGEKNPDRSVWGWNYFQCVLHRWLERERVQAGQSVTPDQIPAAPTLAGALSLTPDQETALFAMLAGEGEPVELRTPLPLGDATEPLQHLTVEPKSFEALVEIDLLDADARWLATRVAVLHDAQESGLATAADLEVARAATRRIVELRARLVWILTSAGAECPYDPQREPEPHAPRHLYALDAIDLTHLLIVHRRVNGARMEALRPLLFGATPEQGPTSWALFFAGSARGLNEKAETLHKRWRLQSLVAMAATAARERLDAERKAKAEQEAAKTRASSRRT